MNPETITSGAAHFRNDMPVPSRYLTILDPVSDVSDAALQQTIFAEQVFQFSLGIHVE